MIDQDTIETDCATAAFVAKLDASFCQRRKKTPHITDGQRNEVRRAYEGILKDPHSADAAGYIEWIKESCHYQAAAGSWNEFETEFLPMLCATPAEQGNDRTDATSEPALAPAPAATCSTSAAVQAVTEQNSADPSSATQFHAATAKAALGEVPDPTSKPASLAKPRVSRKKKTAATPAKGAPADQSIPELLPPAIPGTPHEPSVTHAQWEVLDQSTAAFWASRINERAAAGVQALVATGRELLEAKAMLEHGEFQKLFQPGVLHIDQRSAERLMRIARNEALANPTNWSNLPTAVQSLTSLAAVGAGPLQKAIESGDVTPALTIGETRALVAKLVPQKRRPKAATPPAADQAPDGQDPQRTPHTDLFELLTQVEDAVKSDAGKVEVLSLLKGLRRGLKHALTEEDRALRAAA